MRRFIILALVIFLLVGIVGLSAQVGMAAARPFRPGNVIFPLQDFSEQARARIIFSQSDLVNYYLELAFQRTEDLVVLWESEHAPLAAEYLNQALDRVLYAVKNAPEGDLSPSYTQLDRLILNIKVVLDKGSILSSEQEMAAENLQAKIATLSAILAGLSEGDQATLNSNLHDDTLNSARDPGSENSPESSQVAPHDVLFPPGSPGAMHEFFILDGKHAELDCFACHSDGEYKGTPNLCADCHGDIAPAAHYAEDCAACHITGSWEEISFEHSVVDTTDCLSCHQGDEPERHYAGQCSACHNTEDWQQADFNHEAVDTRNCKSCHQTSKPANHYDGQCSACHNTINWAQANFNHQAVGATDCKSCHNGKQPANHYGGQCSACHNTSNWAQASFNHQAVGATDCKACHSGRKPANHFGGQCSACHSTSSWAGAKFNHSAAGATDCKACHSGRKPANHFDGQCSQCHNTSSWGGASFNHKFPMNHGGANGKCSTCHPAGGSKYNCFACHDKDKTISKHNEEGISNIGGRCVECHRGGGEGGHDD
ncbi:MAG: hypothetical protein JSV42_15300 [Chloroflexota bacterium]|nr:MAG: hypothetical protein JSV42_15300 [Chloroflexota bacterium]